MQNLRSGLEGAASNGLRQTGAALMLESMRNATQGCVGKAIMTVVMGLIIVSFVIWGVGDMLRGFTSSTVATVGGATITAQQFRNDISADAVQQYQRRLRQPFTNEQARAIGLDRQVLQRLISEAALDDAGANARPRHLRRDALRNLITLEPGLPGQVRRVRSAALRRRAARQRSERASYVADLRKTALRQFIFAALTTGLAAPKVETKADADYEGQTRSIDYFVLPAAAAGDIPAPFRGCAQGLLQRPQGELPRARVSRRWTSSRSSRRRSPSRPRSATPTPRPPTPSCRQGPAVRRARKAQAAADPVPERGGGGRRRGEDQGRRELRRHRQGARPHAQGHRPRRDDEGRR